MAVRGRSLIDQASRRLAEMEVPHGVFMANDKRYDISQKVQLVSIDTARSRKTAPPADILIIDEAHYAVSKSFKDFLEFYPDAFWLSVTATPWCDLKHLADDVVYPISMADLVEQKYLVAAKYFAPTAFKSDGLKKQNGEFTDESSILQFEAQNVYADVLDNFKERCLGEPSLCFAVNVEHAKSLDKMFNDAGVPSVVITAITSIADRLDYIDKLCRGDLNVICSVGTMTTGIDIPSLRNLIVCRPTNSKNLHIQMLGRGTRTVIGKDHFKVFDHVSNISRHGFIVDEAKVDLDFERFKKKNKSAKAETPVKTCPECYAVVATATLKCPECQHVFKTKEIEEDGIEGVMEEIPQDLVSRMKFMSEKILLNAWKKGHKPTSMWFRFKEEFGDENVRKHYQVYRKAKATYDDWLHGRAPAPCLFGAQKAGGSFVVPTLESHDW